jgi:hypothetical protein
MLARRVWCGLGVSYIIGVGRAGEWLEVMKCWRTEELVLQGFVSRRANPALIDRPVCVSTTNILSSSLLLLIDAVATW